MTELLWNTIVTMRTSTRDMMVYPVVRPSTTLAYSTLWRLNGRGLHSTPFKWSKDPLEYHSVFLSFTIPRLRGISTTWSLSPLQMMITKKHGCKGGKSNTHKSQEAIAQTRTLVTTWALSSHTEFSTQEELKSLSQRIKCARMKSWCLEMIKECLLYSSMRLRVPFIAPRQLGAVESNPGRQFLPSVVWRTGQSGAPPDRHYSVPGADCFPNLSQPTVEDLEPLAHRTLSGAHRTLSGAHRTVWCPHQTVGSATHHARIARPTVGSPDSPVHHWTVRWILVVRRRRDPRAANWPDSSLAHRTLSGAPRLRRVLAAPAKSFFVFSLILALRQIC
jgi:hypothetical protein